MNALSKSSVKAEDKLFATLDPVTRKIWSDLNKEYLLTDTVGFIDRLPHELIDAFRSTLEEAKYADLLLHVVDAGNENAERQYDVVLRVLESLGAGGKPIITVYNKIDALRVKNSANKKNGASSVQNSEYNKTDALPVKNSAYDESDILNFPNTAHTDSVDFVSISAKTGEGLDKLREKINEKLFS
jgi:GTP-binding protein HflX